MELGAVVVAPDGVAWVESGGFRGELAEGRGKTGLLEEDDFGDAEVVVFCAFGDGGDGEVEFGEGWVVVVVGDVHDFGGIGKTLPGETVGHGAAERLGAGLIAGDHFLGRCVI